VTLTLLILSALGLAVLALAGVVLTLLTLPGVWLTLGAALALQWAWGEPRMFDWWTLAVLAGLALAGEIIETVSSAVGAARSGGGKSGALGSIVGALAGAILGSFMLPVIGTIVGAVLGAGLGAVAAERGIRGRTWEESVKVGKGAAGARAVALIVKTGIAAVVGGALVAGVFL
jgi:uncharacterized protein YqgC (DUF456 family)